MFDAREFMERWMNEHREAYLAEQEARRDEPGADDLAVLIFHAEQRVLHCAAAAISEAIRHIESLQAGDQSM